MKRIVAGIVVAAGLIASPHAIAQTAEQVIARQSKTFRQCMKIGDAARGVTVGILDCNGAELDRQDARLNRLYNAIMARSNPRQKAKLRTLERRWIDERDAHCKRESAPEEGGTLASIIYSSCILDQTIKRTIWLEAYKG